MKIYNVLNLGAGVQSSTLALMAVKGEIENRIMLSLQIQNGNRIKFINGSSGCALAWNFGGDCFAHCYGDQHFGFGQVMA